MLVEILIIWVKPFFFGDIGGQIILIGFYYFYQIRGVYLFGFFSLVYIFLEGVIWVRKVAIYLSDDHIFPGGILSLSLTLI